MPKKPVEEHENADRWLVSYADFITLLFAFFVVMYAISSVNEGKYRVLSSALVNAFRSGTNITIVTTPPTGGANSLIQVPQTLPIAKAVRTATPMQIQEQSKLGNLASDMRRVMSPLVKNGQVNITQTERGVVIEIKDSALFAVGQAQPSPASIAMLTQVAALLIQVNNPVSVEGFTDNVPISTANYPSNWELSAARAGSVVRLFQENGVAPDRLVAVGRAENQPVAGNETPDGRARNRRVSITVLNKGLLNPGEAIPVEPMSAIQQLAASAPVESTAP
jgi:chemotaxis protein MotB